jgi:hypothetical protein
MSSSAQQIENALAVALAKENEVACFKEFYSQVARSWPMRVSVGRPRISRETGEVHRWFKIERFKISQHFLDASARIIQTVWRLYSQRGSNVAATIPAALLLGRLGKRAIIMLERLRWESIVSAWVLPNRGGRGRIHDLAMDACKYILTVMCVLPGKLMLAMIPPSPILTSATIPSMFVDPLTFQYHVISRACSAERLSEFNTRASVAGLPQAKIFDAIDKDAFDPVVYMRQGALSYPLAEVWKKEQNFGDLACMLSHLLLWKRIAEEPGIHIVFEDDADVHVDFLKKLRECLPTLPSDFEYVYLGHNRLHLIM